LIPDLSQWVKDPVLPQAVMEVADAAQMWGSREKRRDKTQI